MNQLVFLCLNFWSSRMVVCQFAGYHSFLPVLFSKLFGKPSLIISGGTDCVSFPSIRYGNFHKKLMGFFTGYSFQWASHIAPVHGSLMLCDYTYQDADFPKQGLLFFRPQIKTPFTVIANGYDSVKWVKKTNKKKNLFVTVVAGLHMSFSKKLKGIDLIMEVAPHFKDCEFMVIGAEKKDLNGDIPSNLTIVSQVENDKLPDHYGKAEFYLQLSMSEGFPNALCEAMLCECIPVVSNVGAMPEIVSDAGFVLPKRDVALLRSLIEKALISDKQALAAKARSRIVQHYPEEKRKNELLDLVKKISVA